MPDYYSVYVSQRPLCAAFLVNTDKFQNKSVELWNVLDAIADYNLEVWGGRSNPLLLFEGDDLPAEGWELLERTDPDLIKGFSDFVPALLSKLDERVFPIAIHEGTRNDDFQNRKAIVRLELMGVPVTPSKPVLNQLGTAQMLMFEFSDSCPDYVRRFVEANFGAYWQWRDPRTNKVRRIAHLEYSLSNVSVLRLEISDVQNLSDALTTLAGSISPPEPRPAQNFIYPWRLQSALRRQPWTAYQLQHSVPVVIGNDPKDYQLFWNAAIWNNSWVDPLRNGLWIPLELAMNHEFHAGLRNWLRHLSGQTPKGVRYVELYSETQSRTELEKLAVELRANQTLFCRVGAHDLNWGKQDWLEKREDSKRLISRPRLGRDIRRFTARSEREVLSLSVPEIVELQNTAGGWMADLQIEFWPGSYRNRASPAWWQLPKRRSTEIVQSMLNGPGRITDRGLPSRFLQADGRSGSDAIPPQLDLHLIPEQQVPPWLISTYGPSKWLFNDARAKLPPRLEIADVVVSEKGSYLAGVIHLFGGLLNAQRYFERQFWLDVFSSMVEAKNQDELIARLTDTLFAELERLTVAIVTPQTVSPGDWQTNSQGARNQSRFGMSTCKNVSRKHRLNQIHSCTTVVSRQ